MLSRGISRLFVHSAIMAALSIAAATPVSAQYFGRNKVQYQTFDFRILQTPHFDVYYYPEEEVATRDAARMAERWYARLSRILNHEFEVRQPLVLYGTHPAFQQTTTLSGEVGEGTGGVTEALKQRVIMPLTGSYQETDHVLGHELVHAFQYDISGLGRFRGSLTPGARAFGGAPLWFTEGMAEYLSIGPVDAHTAMWLRDAVLTGNVPTLEQLTYNPRFFPYRWGQALWAYVGGRWGDATIGQILQLLGQGISYEQAFERVLNIEMDDLSEDWHVAIRRAYLPLLAERPEAREIARPLITNDDEGGRLNLGPSISPDGKYVAFLSERAMDVEIWLADAQSGEVIRRLQKGTAFDAHFQSLRFINSAGTWAPDSKRFAFSAQKGGEDVLVVLDVDRSAILLETTIPNVGEIATPSWSPDGRTIVFSGIAGGISDLYAYDMETRNTRRLTDDLYANLHPSFSPDGRSIAFVTDQGPGTDLANLQFGDYRIALIDATGGPVRPLGGMAGDNINPVWARDGRSLYFVSNRSGIPNVYRVEVDGGQVFRLTGLFGGVSGITDLSPAISAARATDRLLFTAYEENGYNIYALSTARELAGTPATETVVAGAAPLPAQLPPLPRPTEPAFNRVLSVINDPNVGLLPPGVTQQWAVVGYDPKLQLDYVGQPQVGYSVGGVMGQGGLYGGVSGIFSDVLGYHTVFGTVIAQGELDEVGFSAMYLNQKNRWNWGGVAQRVPYITAGQRIQFDPEPGDDLDPEPGNPDVGLLRNQILKFRYFNTALSGVAQYPFSPNRRVEMSGGLRRIAQDVVVNEVRVPARIIGGGVQQIGQPVADRFALDEFSQAWNLGEVSAAMVYDNSLSGYTSPFAGQRYRFEITPTIGDLSFTQATVDYRRYLFLRPFTLAFQGLHFGRYGQDAEDEQVFFPVFLGQPYLLRGYYGVYSDCVNQPEQCENEVFQNLFGSRLGIVKAELRFPLIRALVVGPGIGFPPIEGFGFFDAGTAWTSQTTPSFTRGAQSGADRGILSSAGAGGRVNLFGYAVLEINYVRAFDREGKGWHWQFGVQPGF